MKISVSRLHYPVTTLGPGRRLGIWVQGCSIRCPGCISSDTWAARRPDVEVQELLESARTWLGDCDGVTISGGEPFEQGEAIAELLAGVKEKTGKDVLVYSGLAFADLQHHPLVKSGLIDALISEPYLRNAPQTKPLRGSDNQQLHLLTECGKTIFGRLDETTEPVHKTLDVMFDASGAVWFAGIPRKGDMKKLQKVLATRGHVVTTTESRR